MFPDEREILLKKADYCAETLRKSGKTQFIGFLSEEDLCCLSGHFHKNGSLYASYGGYPDAERRYLSLYDETSPQDREYPIAAVSVTLNRNAKPQTHRDYLGSLLALGLERRIIGDIIVRDKQAFVMINDAFAGFITENLSKIGGESCGVELLEDTSYIRYEAHFEDIYVSVASNRLDAALSEILHTSREQAKDKISDGIVFIDGVKTLSATKELCPGSKISVRGYGKFLFEGQCGNTKSGRSKLYFKRYIQ